MEESEEKRLFLETIDNGCCQRCALRYLGYCKTLITLEYPPTCLANFGFIPPTEEPQNKIRKNNPCSVCLGLLQDKAIDTMLEHEKLHKVEEYQHQTFAAYITFPVCILIRDHSMKIHLKKIFPESFDVSKVMKVNNAWRYTLKSRLCQKLAKSYDHRSKLAIHFYTNYILEEEELAVVQQHTDKRLSRLMISAMLESISDDFFEKLVKIPPQVPLYEIQFQDLKCASEAIFLIGNYCKYSRELPQSLSAFSPIPSQTSIEDILLDTVKSVLSHYKEVQFLASSFDDANIRILGKGRTFRLEISDPKFERVTFEDCEKIKNVIRKTGVMDVNNLREADRRDVKVEIDSERVSTRLYKVLCGVRNCKNINYCINAVNMFRNVTVYQKTPIRVIKSNRKIRTKKIFYIKATKVKDKPNYIELELCTESGFYIPEFVNGDFGRTTPSLCDIMKAQVECIAVDITAFSPTLPCILEPEEVFL